MCAGDVVIGEVMLGIRLRRQSSRSRVYELGSGFGSSGIGGRRC